MSQDLLYLSIDTLSHAYSTRELSPVETARASLDRLHTVNETVNAFSQVQEAITLAQAQASEQRWRRGTQIGKLDGILYSVKDTLMAKGFATRRGSLITSDAPATENAPMVQRMKDNGAVVLGITTTPEFGAGPVTISPLTGITRNAWDPTKTAGGSSGGAAVAIALGIGQVALATDAGGSIRIPAALNGVFGFKATAGRIPTYPSNVAGGLSSPGPITRHVQDAAIVLTAVAQPDSRDPSSLPYDGMNYLERLTTGIKGLKVAFSLNLGYAPEVDQEVTAAVLACMSKFAELGADVSEADPQIGNPMSTYKTLLMSGFAHALSRMQPLEQEKLGPQLRNLLERGNKITLSEYLLAQDRRREIALAMSQFHDTYDLLITPTVAVPAFAAELWEPKHFEKYGESRAWVPFGFPFNLTEQPAASIPCGFTQSGLPIGLQIVAPRFADHLVLRAAFALEAVMDSFQKRPDGSKICQ